MSKNNDVLVTNLKRYTKLNDSTYKILLSYYFTGAKDARDSLTEKDFAPAVAEMFDGDITLIPNTLVDYKALSGNNYKTCLVQATTKIIPVSTASLQTKLDSEPQFKALAAKNVFLDTVTNSIWNKVTTESGIVQLVQNITENLEDLIKRRLDVSEATASANPIYVLQTKKFDYSVFYNTNTKTVESGVILAHDGDNVVVASRQHLKPLTVNAHCVVAAADVPALTQQFEKDLKNSKGAIDVMQAYLNFWFKTDAEGSSTADYIEKTIKKGALKSTASVEEEPTLLQEVQSDIQATLDTNTVATPLTKEEIEVAITSKIDSDKLTNLALVETADNQKFCVKFTKDTLSIDDTIYLLSKLNELFNCCVTVETTEGFVNFILDCSSK